MGIFPAGERKDCHPSMCGCGAEVLGVCFCGEIVRETGVVWLLGFMHVLGLYRIFWKIRTRIKGFQCPHFCCWQKNGVNKNITFIFVVVMNFYKFHLPSQGAALLALWSSVWMFKSWNWEIHPNFKCRQKDLFIFKRSSHFPGSLLWIWTFNGINSWSDGLCNHWGWKRLPDHLIQPVSNPHLVWALNAM